MKVQRLIAFPYVEEPRLAQMHALYRTLCDDLCANIRAVMPSLEILHVTDRDTPFVEGAHMRMRIDRDIPLMPWRTRAQEAAHLMGEEIIFVEPDVRFKASVLEVFDEPFDVAVTGRKVNSDWKLSTGWNAATDGHGGTMFSGTVKLSDIAPYTLGCTFSRSKQFWADCTARILKFPEKEQNWIGDMIGIAQTIQAGQYKVRVIGDEYNHIPCKRNDDCEGVKVLHYKGMRKEWALPGMREAA